MLWKKSVCINLSDHCWPVSDMVDEINSRTSVKTWIILIIVIAAWAFFYEEDYKKPAELIRYSNSYFENLYLQEATKKGIKLKKEESGFYSHYGYSKKEISEIQSKISEEQSKVLVYIYDQEYANTIRDALDDASIKYRSENSIDYKTADEPEKDVVLIFVNSEDRERGLDIVKSTRFRHFE